MEVGVIIERGDRSRKKLIIKLGFCEQEDEQEFKKHKNVFCFGNIITHKENRKNAIKRAEVSGEELQRNLNRIFRKLIYFFKSN